MSFEFETPDLSVGSVHSRWHRKAFHLYCSPGCGRPTPGETANYTSLSDGEFETHLMGEGTPLQERHHHLVCVGHMRGDCEMWQLEPGALAAAAFFSGLWHWQKVRQGWLSVCTWNCQIADMTHKQTKCSKASETEAQGKAREHSPITNQKLQFKLFDHYCIIHDDHFMIVTDECPECHPREVSSPLPSLSRIAL